MPSKITAKQKVLKKYPNASSCNPGDAWYVSKLENFPNQEYKVIGKGATPQDAWQDAWRNCRAK